MSDNLEKVLKVFAAFESRAGDVLLANHFVGVGQRRGWEISGMQQGVEEAYARGLTEKADYGWRLTETGFNEVSNVVNSHARRNG